LSLLREINESLSSADDLLTGTHSEAVTDFLFRMRTRSIPYTQPMYEIGLVAYHSITAPPPPESFAFLDEFSIAAYWTGHYQVALDAAEGALLQAPAAHRARIETNVRLCCWKLGVPVTVGPDVDVPRVDRLLVGTCSTIPSRMPFMGPMVRSLLNQTVKLNGGLELNVPRHGSRRLGRSYPAIEDMPWWQEGDAELRNFVRVVEVDEDLGPATKLYPTVFRYLEQHDTHATTCVLAFDDDVIYPPETVATLWTCSCADDHQAVQAIRISRVVPGVGVISANATGNSRPEDQDDDVIAEGFGGVLYPIERAFGSARELEDYMRRTTLATDDCFKSDDLLISNYVAGRGMPRKQAATARYGYAAFDLRFDVNIRGCGSNDIDALAHETGGHYARFSRVLEWLQPQGLLFFTKRPAPRIGLCMIVKDEEHVIARALASVKPFISTWAIVDTGSTDRTKAVIAETLAGIPGVIEDRPWVNLGHNRSEALRLCDGRMEFAIMIDADDSVSGVPDRFREVVESSPGHVDGYRARVIHGTLQHSRVHVFRMSSQWAYEGAVHDYAVCLRPHADGGANTPLLSGDDFTLEARTEGSRSADPLKYVKDAMSLEAALAQDPDNSRHAFYLAQSYLHAGLKDAAAVAYERRAAMKGTWTEERYVALNRLIELTPSHDRQLAYAWQALELSPSRLEVPYTILRNRRVAGLPFSREALALAREASMACGTDRRPPPLGLFIATEIYVWLFDDEFSIAAYWTGHYLEGMDAAARCLRDGSGIPEAQVRRVRENLRLCAERCGYARTAASRGGVQS
jgi:hypothetical protein